MTRKEKKYLDGKKVRDGEWGIHFSSKSLSEERFDPFCTYLDKDGYKIGHRTIFNPIRLQRPYEFKHVNNEHLIEKDNSTSDTFCMLIKGKLPAIVISKDELSEKDLFSLESQVENLESSIVFTAINLYPPISRVAPYPKKEKKISSDIPIGVSLIHVFTKHYTTLEEIPSSEWLTFFQNYRLTLKESINHKTISSTDKLQVSTFFNIGLKAGASIPHLHGQTIVRMNYQGIGSKQNSFIISSKQNETNCQKCQLWLVANDSRSPKENSFEKRIILRNSHWISILAYAPKRDAQIRLIPYRHISNMWSMNDEELSALSSIWVKSNERLTSFIIKYGERYLLSVERNIILYQNHSAKESHFHMFIDILPVQQTGGAEIFDDQKFSMIYPEEIAIKMISDQKE